MRTPKKSGNGVTRTRRHAALKLQSAANPMKRFNGYVNSEHSSTDHADVGCR